MSQGHSIPAAAASSRHVPGASALGLALTPAAALALAPALSPAPAPAPAPALAATQPRQVRLPCFMLSYTSHHPK